MMPGSAIRPGSTLAPSTGNSICTWSIGFRPAATAAFPSATARARTAHSTKPTRVRPDLAAFPKTTPAHIGYELQIIDDDKETYPTGSIYSLVPAKTGVQRSGAWNSMEVESRNAYIRVRINGQVVAEGPGDPARSKTGPIGLQLHDRFSTVMFRNIRIRETIH